MRDVVVKQWASGGDHFYVVNPAGGGAVRIESALSPVPRGDGLEMNAKQKETLELLYESRFNITLATDGSVSIKLEPIPGKG